MARAEIPRTLALGAYSAAVPDAGVVLPLTVGDPTEGHYFRPTGRELLWIFNNGGTAQVASILGVNDPYGRFGTIAQTIQPGETRIFGPVEMLGWQRADGTVWVNVDSGLLRLACIVLPG